MISIGRWGVLRGGGPGGTWTCPSPLNRPSPNILISKRDQRKVLISENLQNLISNFIDLLTIFLEKEKLNVVFRIEKWCLYEKFIFTVLLCSFKSSFLSTFKWNNLVFVCFSGSAQTHSPLHIHTHTNSDALTDKNKDVLSWNCPFDAVLKPNHES